MLDIASTAMIDAGAIVDRYGELDRVPPLNADLDDAGEAVRNWRARIEAADAVVVASPEYAGSLAGVVKMHWTGSSVRASCTASRSD